jgi:predicted SnoaL-like aldol condensation-catalyzing enzyme
MKINYDFVKKNMKQSRNIRKMMCDGDLIYMVEKKKVN